MSAVEYRLVPVTVEHLGITRTIRLQVPDNTLIACDEAKAGILRIVTDDQDQEKPTS